MSLAQDYSNAILEDLKLDLDFCGVPQQDRMYYLMEPGAWDCNDRLPSGLSHGVEVILTAPTTSKPLWIKSD